VHACASPGAHRASTYAEADSSGEHKAGRTRWVPSLGPTRSRHLPRSLAMQAAREQLPILSMEQEIMEVVDENDVALLCGETGCGKTTQVPQFLLEAGFGSPEFEERAGMIGVTQPRRVAAVSTAHRVAAEVGSTLGDVVGYQVRYDKSLGTGTSIKFMTDGILMREVQDDFLLQRCVLAYAWTRPCLCDCNSVLHHTLTKADKTTTADRL
jgi:HrpA-like RNA helicase